MTGIRGPVWSTPDPSRAAVRDDRLTVSFEDNRILAGVLGEFDCHLALLEDRLGIDAVAHGNVVTLSGPEDACTVAQAVLEDLYETVRQDRSLTKGDIDGAIRLASAALGDEAAPTQTGVAFPAPRPPMARQIRTRKRHIAARSPKQNDYIEALERNDIVFATGPAGTGKTYLAVAYAAMCLENGQIERIILSRPAVEAGERLGFLPGDMREKVDPYLRPLYDALYDVMPAERVQRGLESGQIEIAPLAFMRGRTLANAGIILDEAQNCTAMQLKMALTRIGEQSRMVVTGDPSQVDLPAGQQSGLNDAIALLHEIEEIGTVRFTGADVVRHKLVAKIVEAYDRKDM